MFDHVESSFQHGMAEYTQHAQEQLLTSHSDLAATLKVCATPAFLPGLTSNSVSGLNYDILNM